MCRIVVLMSTYNGEKYLEEQLNSIINQTVKVKIIVRDDGSKDGTLKILDKYKKMGKLEWYRGNNVGFVESFLILMRNAPIAEYYALADQDDYWDKDKLKTGIGFLKKEKKACLYCSAVTFVNEKLKEIKLNDKYSKRYKGKRIKEDFKFEEVLCNPVSEGCTMIFNKYLLDIIKEYMPKNIKFHDRWISILAITFGKIIYDDNSYIKYRQHSNNVIGYSNFKRNISEKLRDKLFGKKELVLKRYCYIRWNFGLQYFYELSTGYGDKLTIQQKQILNDLVFFNKNYMSRLRLFFNKRLMFKSIKNNIYVRLLILFGKN